MALHIIRKQTGRAVKHVVELATGEDHTPRSAWEALKNASIAIAMQASNIHHSLHGVDGAMMQQKTAHLMDYALMLYDHHEGNILNTASSFVVSLGKANSVPLLGRSSGTEAGLSLSDIDTFNSDFKKVSKALHELSLEESLDHNVVMSEPQIEDHDNKINRIQESLMEVEEHASMSTVIIDEEILEELVDHHVIDNDAEFVDPVDYVHQDLEHTMIEIERCKINSTNEANSDQGINIGR